MYFYFYNVDDIDDIFTKLYCTTHLFDLLVILYEEQTTNCAEMYIFCIKEKLCRNKWKIEEEELKLLWK